MVGKTTSSYDCVGMDYFPGLRSGTKGVAASFRFARRGAGLLCLAGAGASEAASFVLVPLFAARLPGSLIPVTAQSLLGFSMLFSALLLQRRFGALQVLGVVVVAAGVASCTLLGASTGGTVAAGGAAAELGKRLLVLRNVAGLACGYGFISFSLALKEVAFLRYRQREEDGLNAGVVNFVVAFWQGLGLFLLWPMNFALITQLSPQAYFAGARVAFRGALAVLVPYLAVNLVYNVMTTAVLRGLSAM
ncbi:unnamed protein product, partial [Prorocentrum cordatum]